jgi:HSF-type DNA-binding
MAQQNNNAPDQNLLYTNGEEMMASNETAESRFQYNDPAVRMSLPFVHKLYLMLNDMEANGYDHIISWIGDGKAFKIHNPALFEALIQHKYFRQSRLVSFTRQASLEFLAIQALTV